MSNDAHTPGQRAINMIGRVEGSRLTVVEFFGRKNRDLLWRCICDCGKETIVSTARLRSGKTRSCGCLQHELRHIGPNHVHGYAAKGKTPEYQSWRGAVIRCENENRPEWDRYGGRGIRICARWRGGFLYFLEDMGHRPGDGYEIDRIDVNGHYSCGRCEECIANGWPANVRWATATQQSRNRRGLRQLEYNGEMRCLSEWAEKLGLTKSIITHRLDRGWSVDEALSTPRLRRYRDKSGPVLRSYSGGEF